MGNIKKIIIAAGGTGGHLYPGIALAKELKKRNCNPVFVLRKNDPGSEILVKEGLDSHEIPVISMPRSFSFRFISFVYYLIISLFYINRILTEENPDMIVGMGGYVSFPAVLVGRLKSIKTLIHEQNYIPGLSNKILSSFVDKIAVSFEDSKKYFPLSKTFITGNPVREDLFQEHSDKIYEKYNLSKDRFTILVFGGSQGARRLNQILKESLQHLSNLKDKVQFLHITGKDDELSVRDEYKKYSINSCVLPYLDTIGEWYCISDIILCRAGASTVAELKILNKPAILVPFPYATNNHQEHNAMTLVKSNQAVLVKDKDLNPEILIRAIEFQLKSFPNRNPKMEIPQRFPQQILADLILEFTK
ncbi:MAG: undecaprenyldiphospho-muramoylpentapeptide beta-N-acetylglucosaminyltransferase [Endomicrobiales bacterium]|nr:undecaprenyldiphospho-muramoylpentapeptide beta-N-acetylglucosaminyltransferase [Endomicrobiales bacterium]